MRINSAVKHFIAVFICVLTVFSGSAFAFAQDENVLTVGVPADRCPVFYTDDESKEITGIGVDLMMIAAENAGFEVSFVPIKEGSLKEALDNDEYDILMPFGSAVSSTKGKNSIVSENLIQTPFTLVTVGERELSPLSNLRVGMLKSQSGVAETVRTRFPGVVVVMFEDMNESVKALRSNEVDALLHNSYVWSYVLQKPSYSDLVVQPSAMFSMDFRAGTLDTPEGRALIERLNTGINEISVAQHQAVTLDYTSRKLYKYDLFDYLYSYGIVIALIITLVILLAVLTIQRMNKIKRDNEKKIEAIVDYDPLTGLLSAEGFKKKAAEIIKRNPDKHYFLSYNNIRDFKFVNDSLGREAGDEVLKIWAKKSLENLSDNEAIGRITADRFAVLRHISGDEKMKDDEDNVLTPVENYFVSRGNDIKVQICSGIYVLIPADYINPDIDHMLDLARVAEKRIRQSREHSFAFYNPEQWEKGKRAALIVGSLQSAINSGDIEVYYQPQINYENNEIIGAEALCRWNHSELGALQPAEFIPILEKTGLIYDLDKYVWNKVCSDLNKWNKLEKNISVSVNLSRGDIKEERNIPEKFAQLIKKYNVPPEQLRIEITESAYVKSPEILIKTTEILKSYGFRVEMDDFGSGYSSLHMLKEVPVSGIKLDLNFLTKSGDPEKSEIIVSCMIQMVKKLGLDLIAEGVETKQQAQFLHSKGANTMQGYYFCKPIPAQEFEKEIGVQ